MASLPPNLLPKGTLVLEITIFEPVHVYFLADLFGIFTVAYLCLTLQGFLLKAFFKFRLNLPEFFIIIIFITRQLRILERNMIEYNIR